MDGGKNEGVGKYASVVINVEELRELAALSDADYRKIQSVCYAVADIVGVQRGSLPEMQPSLRVMQYLRDLLTEAEELAKVVRRYSSF